MGLHCLAVKALTRVFRPDQHRGRSEQVALGKILVSALR